MTKKGFAPVLLLIIVLIIVGLFGLFYFRSQNLVSQMVSSVSENNKTTIPISKPEAKVSPKNPTAISRENLIGIWHECMTMPSGWCDHYHFYSSGKYRLFKNTMDCAKTKLEESGLWTLDGDILNLTLKEEVILKGGNLVKSSGSCGTEMTLTGATKEKVVLQNSKPQVITLKTIGKPVEFGGHLFTLDEMTYAGLFFNDLAYWKFSDDPTSYYEPEEFPEPTDF